MLNQFIYQYEHAYISRYKIIQLRRGYFSAVSFIDYEIGRVLQYLRFKGLEDNTIVVLTSDHGFLLGDKDSWRKKSMFQLASQVPLIISGPEKLIRQG